MLQILHFGIASQRLVEPWRPREQVKVVQWNLKSSFPSAMHLGYFFASLLALLLMEFLYSSNRAIVFSELWIFRILSILRTGACFFSQLDWNMISTIFLLVSSGPNSDTGLKNSHVR